MARTWCGRAAADAHVVHPEVAGGHREVRHLEPGAAERVERQREDPVHAFRAQRFHRGRVLGGPVRDRLGGHGAADLLPDPGDQRQHGGGPAVAVQPHDGGPVVGQDLARLDVVVTVPGLGRAGGGQRHHGRQAKLLADLQADQGLAEVVVGFGDDEVDALVGGPAQLLGIHGAHHIGAGRIVRVVGPRVAHVAGHQGAAFGRHLPGQPHGLPVHRLQLGLAAQLAQLAAMGVIGQRHHHVSARAQELPVQLGHRIGEIHHRLGHVGARLHVAPALQLEDVPLGSQHRALGKAIGQIPTRSCHNCSLASGFPHPVRPPPPPNGPGL